MHRLSLRRLLFVTCIALAVGSSGAWTTRAEPPSSHLTTDPVKQELTHIVDAQLTAFRANDYAKAYTFAAGEIKEMFALESFETMVKSNYPSIAHSAKAEYGLAFDTGEEAVINVTVEGADGKRMQYQYLLKKESGAWKISGVGELKSEGLSV